MRFFVWSMSGDGDSLASRLHGEGHDVVLRIDEAWSRPNLTGMVPHTDRDPRPGEIVVMGTSKLGEKALALRKVGIPVVAGAPLADTMEMDRMAFVRACERLGIDVPETHHFTRYDPAREFVRANGGRWVVKPEGDAEAWSTYVATDAEDMLGFLDVLERKLPRASLIMQRYVDGSEVSCEGWWNGSSWVDGAWNATMEKKKLMNDDVGPMTGCAQSVVYPYGHEPRWAEGHKKWTAMLRRAQYRGPLDLNYMVTNDAMYSLEPCMRFGYHAIEPFVELWDEPMGDVFHRLAEGELDALKVETNLLCVALRLSVPPYPNASEKHRASGDMPVHIDEGDWTRLWPSGIRYDAEEDAYYTAPTDGVIGALVAHGTTLDRAVPKVLAAAKRIRIPQLQYRTDVGTGDLEKWAQLNKWGFDLPEVVRHMLADEPAHEENVRQAHNGFQRPAGPMAVFPIAGKG